MNDPEIIRWLESAEGVRWSRARHSATGNQTFLMCIKEERYVDCGPYHGMVTTEKKYSLWKSAYTRDITA